MKIALVGSAPSSFELAPFDEEEWTIWGCSPGSHPFLRRLDAFYELHRWGDASLGPEYRQWLAAQQCPVYMIEPRPEVPTSVAFPKAELLAKYPGLARSFFTSSVAWMLALAIEQGPEEIGLWGIDMAATEEYGLQKPGCHFFIMEAEKRGIRITVPPESDLLRPVALYGMNDTPMALKIAVRRRELGTRIAEAEQRVQQLDRQFQEAMREKCFLLGALDDLTYFEQTWS